MCSLIKLPQWLSDSTEKRGWCTFFLIIHTSPFLFRTLCFLKALNESFLLLLYIFTNKPPAQTIKSDLLELQLKNKSGLYLYPELICEISKLVKMCPPLSADADQQLYLMPAGFESVRNSLAIFCLFLAWDPVLLIFQKSLF